MKKIEQLRNQRDAVIASIDTLTVLLKQFKKPISTLMNNTKCVSSFSMTERMNIANLLITMFEEVESEVAAPMTESNEASNGTV